MSGRFGEQAHLGEELSALLDGELPGRRAEVARDHLLACSQCTDEFQAVSQARARVRALPPVDLPFGFYERMLLDRGRGADLGRSALRRRAGLAALGAAAAAVTVLGVGSPQQKPVAPAVPRFVEAHASSASVGADLLSKLTPMGVPVSFGR